MPEGLVASMEAGAKAKAKGKAAAKAGAAKAGAKAKAAPKMGSRGGAWSDEATVERIIKQHFPAATATQIDGYKHENLTLRERVRKERAERKLAAGPLASIGALMWAKIRVDFGIPSTGDLLIVKDPLEPCSTGYLEAFSYTLNKT